MSSVSICPECGTPNPASARFCASCAARLGAEPSIVAPRLSAPSRLAASGAIPSRPAPLPAPHANTTAFWVKLGIGGLLLMIGFIGWSVYVLTDVKVVTQLPTGQGSNAAATVAPASASAAATAVPADATLRPLTPSTAATAPSAASAQSAAVPASAPTAAAQTNADRPRDDDDLQRRIEALEKQLAGQRSRAASRAAAARAAEESATGTTGAAATSGWVVPSRSPAMTSSPGYRDAGPPIVRGPEPTVPAEVVRTAPSAVMPAPDGGPPVVEGPGPRYDFSRSGGTGR